METSKGTQNMALERIDRKRLRRDLVAEWLLRRADAVYRHRFWALAVVVALVLAGGGFYAYSLRSEQQQQARQVEYLEALELLGDAPRPEEAERQKARTALEAFVAAHPEGKLTTAAWLRIGYLAWLAEDASAAETAFRRARELAEEQELPVLLRQSTSSLAKVIETEGRAEEARSLYATLPPPPGDVETVDLLRAMRGARGALEAGDVHEAHRLYREVAAVEWTAGLREWSKQAEAFTIAGARAIEPETPPDLSAEPTTNKGAAVPSADAASTEETPADDATDEPSR